MCKEGYGRNCADCLCNSEKYVKMPVMLLALSRLTKSWKNIWAFELWKKKQDSCILNTVQKAKNGYLHIV
ncbi:hypothetical protein DW664_05395 [Lachnospiraceae bacterium AM25-11LB]|nr:hypothetical protein CGC63_01960 [Blautia hansenii DSM 20583]RGD03850.1 hypothetical protein DW675_05385 [Lachnospiraceae bacterium AM25-22]RGD08987.1 hypothetical protein DW664_05395 [Lachnospiraceae bacterium AM25-11LB]RJW12959.1 hypothetical protein DW685_05360 [Lachnospiraceae bacterium AM25-40]RJW17124.1 hypothetical protein DW684_04745 [Lachnospiraceae bacterium AM25-39]